MTVKIGYGTQLLFADHATDFGAEPATAANSLIIGTPTDVQIDLTGVSSGGGARQSAKTGDLGSTRDAIFRVDACIEFESAPTAGDHVDFFWAGSPNSTAGTGNGGGVSGSDSSYTASDSSVQELTLIGQLIVRNQVLNIGEVGAFMPMHRYGTLVVVNNTSAAFRSTATAMDETHITVTPVTMADI